jgi:site-specific DNA-adenine methylase
MKVPHPIQYQGSKRSLASTILRYFPIKFPRLVEPFAGTAAISIACAARRKDSESSPGILDFQRKSKKRNLWESVFLLIRQKKFCKILVF